MYFLTAPDPNYTIKGSRDPLGLQVIWQSAGRRLIPNLSTVSNNIIDYQIMSLAYVCKTELEVRDSEFLHFFIQLEQLMAYLRFQQNPGRGFNGIDKVRKVMQKKTASVKIGWSEQILSNQKAYGIWGKYNRPYNEMGFAKENAFCEVFREKINRTPSFLNNIKRLLKKEPGQVSYFSLELLEEWKELISPPEKEERQYFIDKLLQDKCNNELLRLLNKNEEWKVLSFYDRLRYFHDQSQDLRFKQSVNFIKETEKTISPLNRIFRYLQTRSYWTKKEIEADDFIRDCRNEPNTEWLDLKTKELAQLHALSNYDLVKGLVNRNELVSNNRNSAPWMSRNNDGLEVNHFEGNLYNTEYKAASDNDFNYFFDCFISLFNQLN